MKYFTPELLARCRLADDAVADVAAVQWDKAVAAYNARLQKIRPDLPLGARQLLRQVSLHDAQCLTITTAEGGNEFFLTFRLAHRAHTLAAGVELRYTLTGTPTLLLDKTKKASEGSVIRHVLYDEFDLEPKKGAKVFTHHLLMTGGLEMRIRFANLRLRWFGSILLANSQPSEFAKEWEDNGRVATT
jgi:hypothetical protein